jgi:hypothetical protein
MKRIISLVAFLVISFSYFGKPALAVDVPNFPSCSAPQGTIKVSYPNGNHGIVGSMAQYQGRDTVYTINDTMTVQCFCSPTNQGIQTNWWKTSSLTDSEMKILINQGWTYVPNGELWGLQNSGYMTRNLNFTCTDEGNSPTPTPTPTTNGGGQGGQGGDNGSNNPGGPYTCPDPAPNAPTILSVNRKSDTSITVSWTAVSPVTQYGISYGKKSGKYDYGQSNIGNVTTFTVNDLASNQNYCFVVNAVNNCNSSPFSSEVCMGGRGGQVLGASTTGVLGFSTTSSDKSMVKLGIFLIGLLCLTSGLYLKRIQKKS